MPTTDPLLWLQNRIGAEVLPGAAFEAAMKFALLWMYFEGQACGAEASSKRLRDFAKDLYARKLDQLRGQLDGPLGFFKERYREVSSDPDRFIRRLGEPKRIKAEDQESIIAALTNAQLDEVDKAIGLLLICFRIRNNLFHGSKELQALQQQQDLFANVGDVLTALLEARSDAPIEASRARIDT